MVDAAGDYISRGHRPLIGELPDLDTYQKNSLFVAVSMAYSGIYAWAFTGSWSIKIETAPPREIVFSNDFVAKNVVGGQMTQAEITRLVKSIADTAWTKNDDGSLSLLLS